MHDQMAILQSSRLCDSDRTCVAQFLILQASEDGQVRHGAINAAAEKVADEAHGHGWDVGHAKKFGLKLHFNVHFLSYMRVSFIESVWANRLMHTKIRKFRMYCKYRALTGS